MEKERREQMIAEIQRYMETEFDLELGNLASEQLLEFFEKKLTSPIYNQALGDVVKVIDNGFARIDDDIDVLKKPIR